MPSRTLEEERSDFERQLPELLRSHRGEFVLFKDGAPVEFFRASVDAFDAGLGRFGKDAIFLVAEIQKPEPVSISLAWDAGVMFG